MWAHTTLRHSLRHSMQFGGGKLALSSGIGLSLLLPVSARLFASSAAQTGAECTRWLMHEASPSAPRECPTPLVFLRTPRLEEQESYRAWADVFASRGYTSVEVDITVDPSFTGDEAGATGAIEDSSSFPEPINAAKNALNAQLKFLNVPFAPIVVATGLSGLVAQAFVSDHAASGLVLIDPPADTDPRESSTWKWPVFNYEPRFPILLMPNGSSVKVEQSRVGRAAAEGVGRGGRGVSIENVVDGVRSDKTRMEIERWMDRCGW